ncbi:MAG: chemotaxis protein CheX [Epsilonproteobacteria bacterium]|nr:chemotaxis protein CheX [Campylobacterota bacterium]
MFESIVEATKNFCIHQIGSEAEIIDDTPPEGKTLVVRIDIQTQTDDKFRIYLASDRNFVQNVAQIFLDEEKSDTETLHDMALECINLIVGSAKVIASQKELHFNIETPHLQEMERFDIEYSKSVTILCNNNKLFIAMQKID